MEYRLERPTFAFVPVLCVYSTAAAATATTPPATAVHNTIPTIEGIKDDTQTKKNKNKQTK